ncbi:unnamed protein product [Litomosoides sigmodontis]|uniref:p-granule-associated protein DEPS-1 second OB-fold domain-containing protein n=1 Tax=Litomosoides sigmodontis TaxID=42156 RepID=A0A3P6TVK4_LITSI|nr:unnamed protein product [Litomosoides sigmodontis]
MSKRIGLISHQADNGLLHVFVPGIHPDLVIDQRKISNDEQRFHVGDFILFIDVNGSVTLPTRIKKLFQTRIVNNKLQIKVPIALPPEEFVERTNFTTFIAWSPNFTPIGCPLNVAKTLSRNQMYDAWIERVQNTACISIPWQIVDIFDECDEQRKKLINNAYINNYKGLVVAIHDSDAIVWSLAIPDSEVVFLFGVRMGMKVGDWIQFNCTPILYPHRNCYLQGKKFEVIEPLLPAKDFNNTVQVEVSTTISVENLNYYPTGEVTVETETLGAVEFEPRKFRHDYCNRCLSLIVCKNIPSKQTGAVWRVFCVVNKVCPEFMQNSCSDVNFSNKSDSPSEKFVTTKDDECNAKVEMNENYHFTESQLQEPPDPSLTLPEIAQKEVDDSFDSDFSCNNTFGNDDLENLRIEEEYDLLKKPVFGAVKPHVLQINCKSKSSTNQESNDTNECNSDTNEFYALGNCNIDLNEEFSEDEQEELNNRAVEYWVRAWQLPQVRRQILEADKTLYAKVVQLMKDLNAETDEDNLEELQKSSQTKI